LSTGIGSRQIGALALRILGIIWLLRAIGHIPALIGMFATRPSRFEPGNFNLLITASFVGFMLNLLLAWLLLFRADRVAARIFPDSDTGQLAVTAEECLAVALAVVGAYVVVDAIPKVGEAVINFKYMKDSGRVAVAGSWIRGNWVVLTGSIGQLVVGISLFVRSRYLASLWSTFEANRTRHVPGEVGG
jgi:hypothetical protein